jgi:hypothetical protein
MNDKNIFKIKIINLMLRPCKAESEGGAVNDL